MKLGSYISFYNYHMPGVLLVKDTINQYLKASKNAFKKASYYL